MATVERLMIEPPAGYRSQEVALFISQMDDQSHWMTEQTRDLTPDELAWQPKPGMNTIGMLLCHMAVVEVWWTMLAIEQQKEPRSEPILGIDWDDDGMPLPEDGLPPAGLRGKDLAFYDDLHRRAREYLKKTVRSVSDADLLLERTRTRANGTQLTYSVRWYFYHIFEHFCGHYGQILLLRHLYKTARVPAKA